MQPNDEATDTDLAMNGLTIGSAVDAARGEAQSLHEEVMLRSDVLAHKNRDEFFAFAHNWIVADMIEVGNKRKLRSSTRGCSSVRP
jgi:hypothetical protein